MTFTKERVAGIANGEKCYTHDDVAELARIALASLEAGAVAEVCEGFTLRYIGHGPAPKSGVRIGDRLYTAPPEPVSVPDDVMAAIQKVARIRLDLNDFDGDKRGIADSLGEAEEALIEVVNRRAAMLQGADGTLTNEGTKQVGELVMWVKRLAHSLRKTNPDSKLQSDAMDYLSRKGLIGVEDILR